MPEQEIGIVEHWFGHLNVAGIKVTKGNIRVGDKLHFKGHTSDFQETVQSIQVEHKLVSEAKVGDEVGIKVSQKAREHDKIFKIT